MHFRQTDRLASWHKRGMYILHIALKTIDILAINPVARLSLQPDCFGCRLLSVVTCMMFVTLQVTLQVEVSPSRTSTAAVQNNIQNLAI